MIHLANFVRLLFAVYIILIFVRVLFAWIRPNMFNPLVRFVYTLTDPFLRLFACIRFRRIREFDFTPLLALLILFLIMELSYEFLKRGDLSWAYVLPLLVKLFFRFLYFFSLFFMVVTGLRVMFEFIGRRVSSGLVAFVYSLSEPVVKPFRKLRFRSGGANGFDLAVVLSLAVLFVAAFLILPKAYGFTVALLREHGFIVSFFG